ncbi:MAG: hypothetical protein AB7P99_13830 [Vicinamibacterales bacterium]
MTLLWFVAGASLIAALLALWQARRAAAKLEQLSQLYWELKYQYGEQRVQLQRLAGEAPPPPAAAPPRSPTEAFVPLSNLKR